MTLRQSNQREQNQHRGTGGTGRAGETASSWGNTTMSAEAAKEGWTARMELDTWLSNYQIDPEALGRNEQVLVVTAFMAYWQEWFESSIKPNTKTSTSLGELTRLLSVLAK